MLLPLPCIQIVLHAKNNCDLCTPCGTCSASDCVHDLQNLGSLEQVALEIDGGGGLSPQGYGSGGGFGSTGGSLTMV